MLTSTCYVLAGATLVSAHASMGLNPSNSPELVASMGTCDLVQNVSQRVWCGPSTYTDLYPSAAECASKKCCFDPDQANSSAGCTYPTYEATPLKRVMVVQASHFDAGFLNSTVNIINLWFTKHFPRAWTIGEQLRARGKSEPRMNFMTQSWLVSLYLDCPTGMGLACPDNAALVQFKDSIAKGYLTWHAHPFNSELGIADPLLTATGTDWTHAIDDAFNLTRKATLSQRDVPGIPRASMIPLLGNRGVKALSVGANDGSSAPAVPRAFVWRDSASGAEILGLWHSHGYGGYGTSDAVVVPGLDTALVFYWLGDNHGPADTMQNVLDTYSAIQKTFPGTEVITAEFDDFVVLLDGVREKLPVLDQEIDETWSHGVASDPLKEAMGRVAMREFAAAVADQAERQGAGSDAVLSSVTSAMGPAVANFTRLFIKLIEHTDGKDVKTWLKDYANWTNPQVRACISDGLPNWITMIDSWQEQRNFDLYYPMQALAQAWLAPGDQNALALSLMQNITAGWKQLRGDVIATEQVGVRAVPDRARSMALEQVLEEVTLASSASVVKDEHGRRWLRAFGGPAEFGSVAGVRMAGSRITIKWDEQSGRITTFDDAATGAAWASASRPLAYLDYRTYSEADFVSFLSNYDSRKPSPPPSYMYKDFGKPNETATHEVYGTSLVSAWIQLPSEVGEFTGEHNAPPAPSVVLRVKMQPTGTQGDPHVENGAPIVSDILLWQPAGSGAKNADSVLLYGDARLLDLSSVHMSAGGVAVGGFAASALISARSDFRSRWNGADGTVPSVELPLDVIAYNKTISRLPEAMFVRFNPDLGAAHASGTQSRWRFHTVGEWMEPADVVIAGNNEYHVVQAGIAATTGNWSTPGAARGSASSAAPTFEDPALAWASSTRDAIRSGNTRLVAALPVSASSAPVIGIATVDANVAVAGNMTMFPLPLQADVGPRVSAEGAGFCLWNNIWSTK